MKNKYSMEKIPIEQLPELRKVLQTMIEQNNQRLERMYCVFTTKTEPNEIFVLTPYDFLNLNFEPQFYNFDLYQVIE